MLVKTSRNRVRVTERFQAGSIARDYVMGVVRAALARSYDPIELSVKGTNYPAAAWQGFVNNY